MYYMVRHLAIQVVSKNQGGYQFLSLMLTMAVKTFVITVMMTGEGQTPETLCSGQCYHMHCVKNDFMQWTVLCVVCKELFSLHIG